MNQYRAVDGDRLDIVVFKAYGSIDVEVMDAVMEENKHLLGTSKLTAGDVVFLPVVDTEQSEADSKALWK